MISIEMSEFVAAMGACVLAASSDETRPHLTGVLVKREEGVLTLCATDGHWLAKWEASSGEGEGNVLIAADICADALKAAKKLKGIGMVVIDPSKRSITVGSSTFSFPDRSGLNFPPYQQVIPRPGCYPETDQKGGVGLGAHLLGEVCKAFIAASGRKNAGGAGLFFEMGNALDPVVCTNSDIPALMVVVMPMRMNAAPSRASAPVSETRRAA